MVEVWCFWVLGFWLQATVRQTQNKHNIFDEPQATLQNLVLSEERIEKRPKPCNNNNNP